MSCLAARPSRGERRGCRGPRSARGVRLTVRAGRVLGKRVHPDSGAHLTYVACAVLAGAARVADAEGLDAVEWVPAVELGARVPGGLYLAVEEYPRRQGSRPCGSCALTGIELIDSRRSRSQLHVPVPEFRACCLDVRRRRVHVARPSTGS